MTVCQPLFQHLGQQHLRSINSQDRPRATGDRRPATSQVSIIIDWSRAWSRSLASLVLKVCSKKTLPDPLLLLLLLEMLEVVLSAARLQQTE